ncbi:unnamed protein product [Bursaphelenchus xylophilus]|uniref:Hexosyltransferase n=1 Tax=Bursaphelenchus xylophilus TaxID=6326 RepID=A0A1I7SAQ5_BURXY|nr:unnamed protein product [Bursaphelenchus xylophilus]CAG9126887.1 unnamed protein product [Bursaphelenchus xylophilus]
MPLLKTRPLFNPAYFVSRYIHCSLLEVFSVGIILWFIYHSMTSINEAMKRKTEVHVTFKNTEVVFNMDAPEDPAFCNKTNVFIVIFTRTDGFERREIIRNTWMHDKSVPKDVTIRFIIGTTENEEVNKKLRKEMKKHRDIIRYDYVDRCDVISFKMHTAFFYKQKYCPNAKYFIKTDDDTVLDLNRTAHYLRTLYDPKIKKTPEMLMCHIKPYDHRKDIVQENKFYVPEHGYYNKRIEFCQGCTFMATSAAVNTILNTTRQFNLFHIDDVLYGGLVITKTNITMIDNENFGHEFAKTEYKCDDHNVPLPLAQYGLKTEAMENAYAMLKNIQCSNKPKMVVPATPSPPSPSLLTSLSKFLRLKN